ncbi:MAG: UDP-glucose 4-epimerase [Chloroflexi bacterium RBG_13_54_8]|nr:MAG: UDP-glucose 4-epimerase [Chloroflexi bacterium RBG_13_54_8]
MSNNKQFVTGGAGFIGSHLVDRLMAEGKTVTVYDNLSSGKKAWIQHHFGKPNFRFIEADLLDLGTLKRAIKGHEVVWHFGANTDIPGGNEVTDLDLRNCTIATWNTLEAMRGSGIIQLIFASSSAVYGEAPVHPTPESVGPLLPISLYGAGKLACEGIISAYSHLFGIQTWMFRFANVLGERMGHGVIYDFIHKLRKNPRQLEILGDGSQEKNFFLTEDCLDGIFFAYRQTNGQCDVFNLGCEGKIRVTDIAEIVVEEMGLKDVEFQYTGGKRGWPGDVPQVIYDVSKMKVLGWKPRYASSEAVRIATRRLLKNSD